MTTPKLLDVRQLSIRFRTENGIMEAVKNVSFSVNEGESLAIVGESGSGKSVTALSLTRLFPNLPRRSSTARLSSAAKHLQMAPRTPANVRGGGIAYIFQEPSTSLNPVYSIRSQIAEAIKLHRREVQDVESEIVRCLTAVGIVDPSSA